MTKKILYILGLGYGTLEQLPLRNYRKLKEGLPIYVRTIAHPVVQELQAEGIIMETFDHLYEQEQNFSLVYDEIVNTIEKKCNMNGSCDFIYAVPGHPMIAEQTVQKLLKSSIRDTWHIEVMSGQSFLDPAFLAFQFDPVEGFLLLDGTDLKNEHLSLHTHTLITQIYDVYSASEIKLTLMERYPSDYQVYLGEYLGIKNKEKIRALPLYEIDHKLNISNHLVLYLPPVKEEKLLYREFGFLRQVIAKLRSPEGCPWDREQTHQSLKKYFLEEVYEALDAIDQEDDQALANELGDVLLQILLHSQIAEENGFFTVDDVIEEITKKMIRRHPHVFQQQKGTDVEEVLANWEQIKQEEKLEKGIVEKSILAGVAKNFPALIEATKLQKKAAKVGFDWDHIEKVWEKLYEEADELKRAANDVERLAELGDLLFAVVNLARFYRIEPELALQHSNKKFRKRFNYIENKVSKSGRELATVTLEEMEKYWQEAKVEN